MRRLVETLALGLAFAAASGVTSAASTADMPTVPACANPALPGAILGSSPSVAIEGALATTTARAPRVALTLAVADDQHTRELGLMCVLRLAPKAGMVFVFDHDGPQTFWMKNTLVPLDMIWVRADGTVDAVAANVPASTRTTPDKKIARRAGVGEYVIELASGEAVKDGLARGERVTFGSLPSALP